MPAKVLSFRAEENIIIELENRKIPEDSSISITAQRLLTEYLGLAVPDLTFKKYVDDSIAVLRSEVEELRSRLDNPIEPKLVTALSELLDSEKYPPNNSTKLKKRVSELISELIKL